MSKKNNSNGMIDAVATVSAAVGYDYAANTARWSWPAGGGSLTNIKVNSAPAFVAVGQVTTDFGHDDYGNSVIVQADGKILVAGYSDNDNGSSSDFALVRYNTDGSLDTGFDGDGKVTTDFGHDDYGNSVTVQADGKILVAGYSGNYPNGDFALVRYNTDGSLDTSFDGDGKVTTDFFGHDDDGNSVTVQADGKILVAGKSFHNGKNDDDFALVRYNTDGSLDTGFDGDGKVTTDVRSDDYGCSVTVQTDGKILVAGYTYNAYNTDFALARYNTDGSLDTGFDGDGKVTTDFGYYDYGNSVTVQADGKILVAGQAVDSDNRSYYGFALMRYNNDGSLDTGFDGDGKVTTYFGHGHDDYGSSVTVQADGKILVAGSSYNGKNYDFALVRYNTDGSLDTGFDGDGNVTTDFGPYDRGYSVTVQADGKILVAGTSYNDSGNGDFALVRYNADGSLDNTFGTVNTLNGTASYTESGVAVALDRTVQIYDAELVALGNYTGASITLARHGGANSEDVFSGSDRLNISGSNALFSHVNIGTVSNSHGTLKITFNSNATQARVNTALSSLAYSNTSDLPPASVTIDWTFNDGNTGAQGAGGALTASGSTTVNITPINHAPVLTVPAVIHYVDTAFDDSFLSASGALTASDVDSSSLTYGIAGGKDNGDGTVSKITAYGTLTVTQSTGAYSFIPKDHAIERLNADGSRSFTVTVSDGLTSDSKPLIINITQSGSTESTGNDTLTGTAGNNVIRGLAGDDALSGKGGNDALYGGEGHDVLSGANGNDVLHGRDGDDTLTGGAGNDRLNGGKGNDMLEGGAGKDIFSFNSPLTANIDNITDFKPVDDTIRLENGIFTRLTTTGVLKADNFVIAATAVDSNDYLVYNQASGALLYDADGNGAEAAVQIAVLGVNLALTNDDFVVI